MAEILENNKLKTNSGLTEGHAIISNGSSSQLLISEESQNKISQYQRAQQQQIKEMQRINQIGEEDDDDDDSFEAPMIDASYMKS